MQRLESWGEHMLKDLTRQVSGEEPVGMKLSSVLGM